MINYKELNDYELVDLAQEKNEDALLLLHEKYLPLIQKKSRKFFQYLKNKGTELMDITQECTIGFEEAIQNFNPNDNVSFYTFANICMDRQLISEVARLNRHKYKFLNEAIPLETIDDEENSNLIDFIQDNSQNPELGLLKNEGFNELLKCVNSHLTNFEECVFNLKLQNFSYKEIATILEKDEKSIDNAIQRIKTKIKTLLNDSSIHY